MIGIVSCAKQQKDGKTVPKELFMESPRFKKARKYCEQHYGKWYILSAKYGLLHPDKHEIEPYEERLNDAGKEKRGKWSETVFNQLKKNGLLEETLVFHTGKAYYEDLLPLLDEAGVFYLLPLKGRGYPQQIAWYNNRVEE